MGSLAALVIVPLAWRRGVEAFRAKRGPVLEKPALSLAWDKQTGASLWGTPKWRWGTLKRDTQMNDSRFGPQANDIEGFIERQY